MYYEELHSNILISPVFLIQIQVSHCALNLHLKFKFHAVHQILTIYLFSPMCIALVNLPSSVQMFEVLGQGSGGFDLTMTSPLIMFAMRDGINILPMM